MRNTLINPIILLIRLDLCDIYHAQEKKKNTPAEVDLSRSFFLFFFPHSDNIMLIVLSFDRMECTL